MTAECEPKQSAAPRFRASAALPQRRVHAHHSLERVRSPQPLAADAAPAPMTATVLRVVDGDTIDVRDDTRGRLRIRDHG
jgi:endonuclease YncB( thermonuclease family)